MNIKKTGVRALMFLILATGCSFAFCQTPFLRTGQIFLLEQNTNELTRVSVSPVYNSLQTDVLGGLPPGGLNALGFRKTDNLLYGINPANNRLYRVGVGAAAQNLGPAGLDNTLIYTAGDVSPDGKFLFSVGSNTSGSDVHLAKTGLETAPYTTAFIPLTGNRRMADIAFDPFTGFLYGYDATARRVVRIDAGSGTVSELAEIKGENDFFGLFFDAFGDLYAYGSAVNGIVDGLFLVNKNTGQETRLVTGPKVQVADMASCPFSVEIKNSTVPAQILPCSDLVYTFKIANGSGETLKNLDFEHFLPPGFRPANQPAVLGVVADTLSVAGALQLKNLTLPPGTTEFSMKVRAGDVPKGRYNSQGNLKELPQLYGTMRRSDNLLTPGFEDSTTIAVNRFEEDSLYNFWFICHGESFDLNGTEYGNELRWSTGASTSVLTVNKGGLYTLEAGNTCESIFVSHDVTSASCPYTIALANTFMPDSLFACSELVWRFILRNDSGEPRKNVSLRDSLPVGFDFVKILKNPFGGKLVADLPPNLFLIKDLTLKTGIDTLDILVAVGDVLPGVYKNRAVLYDLPLVMGPIRLSDDPKTFAFDSSSLYILGARSDSLFFEKMLCPNSALTLDARGLGKNFRWDDGSTRPEYTVKQPGDYRLRLLDGCRPATVLYRVSEGDPISVIPPPPYSIHQGEEIRLRPIVLNARDSLFIRWTDPLGASLSCINCPAPQALPLQSVRYGIKVSNGVCSDSAVVQVEVDQSRRVYAPNIFSPNDDGENDYFYLQSPDFGKIRTFFVYDRWGNVFFESSNSMLGEASVGWDGFRNGEAAPMGVYLWWAELEFADGSKKIFQGDITLIK
jgi:gliding motility-associated-like protein